MSWLSSLKAALALLFVVSAVGHRYASDGYDERGLGDFLEEELPQERSTSKMLNALFGPPQSTPRPPEDSFVMPHQYYSDFYEDLLTTKRNDVHSSGCDCKVTNNLLDLGSQYFPRYLMNAVCESQPALDAKCTHGSNCKPLEYRVKVLAAVSDRTSGASSWLNKDLLWEFKTFSVNAGCFCAK